MGPDAGEIAIFTVFNRSTRPCDNSSFKGGTDVVRIPRRHHYLLCAEGFTYFLLALMDFLTHVIPALHQNLLVFKIVDITLGS